jgi:hypothetical protein
MPVCTFKDCTSKGIELPLEDFVGNGRIYKQCQACRQRQMEYKQHAQTGMRGKGYKQTHTPIGTEPTFAFPGHKRMWQRWLVELASQVER